jgi:hypothetical protein
MAAELPNLTIPSLYNFALECPHQFDIAFEQETAVENSLPIPAC